ncbi:MAG TPA: zinc-binding dehydrogenase, partial [Nocardiopsis listeri]|uniref:zinc-binding dehydrogenase n=1 Tax=Nocardiopsis listeri TaxID=53440 RepID=UPI001DE21BBD
NLVMVGRLKAGETVLLHGGGSGIGTFAIQFARALGARVAVTAGSDEKLERCRELGAEITINYRTEDFTERMRAEGGADVVLDIMGGSYLDANLRSLATNGRLVIIGLMGGRRSEIDLGRMLAKRLSVQATTLRSRPAVEKAEIVSGVLEHVWPLVEKGTIRPVVDRTVPLRDAAEAHRVMESSAHTGKILLAR